ncbi:MAG: sulfur carrier protein ThiS [Candidatus Omnitrophota bacterium]
MNIKINGKEETVSGIKTILELINDKKLIPEHIVVEQNFKIVPKEEWARTVLNEDDKIEIVSFVGGG